MLGPDGTTAGWATALLCTRMVLQCLPRAPRLIHSQMSMHCSQVGSSWNIFLKHQNVTVVSNAASSLPPIPLLCECRPKSSRSCYSETITFLPFPVLPPRCQQDLVSMNWSTSPGPLQTFHSMAAPATTQQALLMHVHTQAHTPFLSGCTGLEWTSQSAASESPKHLFSPALRLYCLVKLILFNNIFILRLDASIFVPCNSTSTRFKPTHQPKLHIFKYKSPVVDWIVFRETLSLHVNQQINQVSGQRGVLRWNSAQHVHRG